MPIFEVPDFEKPIRKDQEIDQMIEEIENMLESGLFEWAEETLQGILENVEVNERITPRQKNAIENIAAKVEDWELKW